MKGLYRISVIVLINIYLVIIAGSVVRMTGSGMGCPDWPKCFGYLIPPTQEDQIKWKPNTFFEKKQMVIHSVQLPNNSSEMQLLVAQEKFKSGEDFNINNWKKYEKHNYATFNVFHTWTEYINRLLGALLGLFALIMLGLSIKNWKTSKSFTLLSFLQLFFIGFEAWLGKVTVDANLAPVTITYHMLGVLVLIVFQLILIKKIKQPNFKLSPTFYLSKNKFIVFGILLLITQIIMGTQVRQQVDHLLEAGVSRDNISSQFDTIFYIHRSFSLLLLVVLGTHIFHLYRNKHIKLVFWIGAVLLGEILIGMFLSYLGMQAIGQPFHLFLSILLFGLLVQSSLRKQHRYVS